MDKQKVFVFLVLISAVLSQMAGDCFADAASDIQTAENYYNNGLYQQAEQICQSILGKHSGTDDAFEAQKKLAILYIAWGKGQQATAAVDALKTDFSDNVHITEAVHDIGQQYRQFQQYNQAAQLYQYVIDSNSGCEYAIWAQMDIAISNIFLGDGKAADAAVEKLLTDYSGDERIAEAVYGVANQYRGFQKYEKADQLYQHIITNWPQSEHAKWAQMALVMSNVIAGNAETGDTAIENLISQFSGSANITKAVHDIAQQYRWLENYDKACKLYQYVLDHKPEGDYKIWAQMDLAISNIRLGNMQAAEAGISKLITEYSDSKHIATVIYSAAQQCCWAGKYDKAREYYQYILDHRPEGEYARWSRMGLATLDILPLIEVGNQTKTQAAIDSLITDFSDCPDMPDAIDLIVLGYHEKTSSAETSSSEDCRNLISVWEKVTKRLPNLSFRYPDPYLLTADRYRQLGEYDKAIQNYNALLANWPDCKYAWHAHYLVGSTYQQMKNAGLISKVEADTATRRAYEQLVKESPGCKAAPMARRWLTGNK